MAQARRPRLLAEGGKVMSKIELLRRWYYTGVVTPEFQQVIDRWAVLAGVKKG